MCKYKLLIFDWDGTLVDSRHAVINSIQVAAKKLGCKPPSADSISIVCGLTLRDMADELVPGVDYEKFADCYHENYARCHGASLFCDVLPALKDLYAKGYLMAIATNKVRSSLMELLKTLKLENFFMTMRCGDDRFIKPNPAVILSILEELSVEPSETLIIGDSVCDMLVAQGAGVGAIAVAYGANTKHEALQELLVLKPKGSINSFSELRNFLA